MVRRRRPRRRVIRVRDRFRSARKAAGLTQKELAELSGCTPATVYDIEHGRNLQPSYLNVVRILGVLHTHGLPDITAEQVLGTARVAHPRTRRDPA